MREVAWQQTAFRCGHGQNLEIDKRGCFQGSSGFILRVWNSQDDGPHTWSPALNIQMLRAEWLGRNEVFGCGNEKATQETSPQHVYLNVFHPMLWAVETVLVAVASFCGWVHQNLKISIVWSWQAQASAMQKHGRDWCFDRRRCFLPALLVCSLAVGQDEGPTVCPYCMKTCPRSYWITGEAREINRLRISIACLALTPIFTPTHSHLCVPLLPLSLASFSLLSAQYYAHWSYWSYCATEAYMPYICLLPLMVAACHGSQNPIAPYVLCTGVSLVTCIVVMVGCLIAPDGWSTPGSR